MKKLICVLLMFLSGVASAELPLHLKFNKSDPREKEIIRASVKNLADSAVLIKSISLQQFSDNTWTVLFYHITCPCLSKCNVVSTSLEPKKELSLAFDFKKMGCGQVEQGTKYRVIAEGLRDAEKNQRTLLGESEPFIAKE